MKTIERVFKEKTSILQQTRQWNNEKRFTLFYTEESHIVEIFFNTKRELVERVRAEIEDEMIGCVYLICWETYERVCIERTDFVEIVRGFEEELKNSEKGGG